jgi:hypothetical protein
MAGVSAPASEQSGPVTAAAREPQVNWEIRVTIDEIVAHHRNARRLRRDACLTSRGTAAALLELSIEQAATGIALGFRRMIDHSQFGLGIRRLGLYPAIQWYRSKASLVLERSNVRSLMIMASSVQDDALNGLRHHGPVLKFLRTFCDFMDVSLAPSLDLVSKAPERFPPTVQGQLSYRQVSDRQWRTAYVSGWKETISLIRRLDPDQLDEVKKAGFYVRRIGEDGPWEFTSPSRTEIRILSRISKSLTTWLKQMITEARAYDAYPPSPMETPLDWTGTTE